MHENVYLNGRVVPSAQASVSVWDAGLLHGASAFTTMLVRNGLVFRLDRHLNRLFDTVDLLNLRTSATPDSLTEAVVELVRANGLGSPARQGGKPDPALTGGASEEPPDGGITNVESRMRITLTPGSVLDVAPVPEKRGQTPIANDAIGVSPHFSGTILITTEPWAEYIPQWREEGITVVVAPFKQLAGDPTFGYKTGCYLPRILARREAALKGAHEALWFTTDNHLAEACFRNVFVVLDGKVFTPPRDTPVLPGVVREAVIELCGELGIPCDQDTPLTIRELLAAKEVFLTGSGLGVCPVVRIERHAVADEKPGEITRKIMAAYEELLQRECP